MIPPYNTPVGNKQDKTIVKVTNILLKILELVYNEPGITMTEIVKRLRLSKQTVYKAVLILSDKYKLIRRLVAKDTNIRLVPYFGICDVDGKYLILPIIKESQDGKYMVGFQVIFLDDKNTPKKCCKEFIESLPEKTREEVYTLIKYVYDSIEKLKQDPYLRQFADEIKKELEKSIPK